MFLFDNIGKKIGKFYFGIGGIGDLFLLLASYYDDIQDKDASLIFWANNPTIIKIILKHFTKHKHIIVTENFLNNPAITLKYYNPIVSDPFLQGKGHIPNNLQYLDEWTKINNVFDYYSIKRYPEFLMEIFDDKDYTCETVIQPYSFDDSNVFDKGKIITDDNIIDIILNTNDYQVIIGSPKERQHFKDFLGIKGGNKYFYPDCIIDSIKYVVNSKKVYAVDSWVKVVSGLANIKTTLYTRDKSKLFPSIGYDPGDNIFIKNWGFEIITQNGS
jgi:phosphotransferase system IIB component